MPSLDARRYTLNAKRGFTLIELLIVITIIGILATLTLASYGNAQAKGRDGVRKSDLAQLKRALELAKSDCQSASYYPYFGTDGVANYNSLANYLSSSAWGEQKYISSVIKDPKDPTYQYKYYTATESSNKCPSTSGGSTQSGATDYSLVGTLERTQDSDGMSSWERCGGGSLAAKPGVEGAYTPGQYFICNN